MHEHGVDEEQAGVATKGSRFEEFMTVTCSYCWAKPGERCVNVIGGTMPLLHEVHLTRVNDHRRSHDEARAIETRLKE